MIENLRKYPGVILAALVAVFIGFLFMDSQSFFQGGSKNSLKVNGKSYNSDEVSKLGSRSQQLAMQQSSYQSMDMYQFVLGLSGDKQDDGQTFFKNRIILRQAAKDFGIQPSEKEIDSFIQEKTIFVDQQTSKFDNQKYKEFLEKGIGKLGMGENDYRDIIKDVLSYQKISALLGSSIEPNLKAIKLANQASTQKVTASYITLNLSDYTAKQNPAEADIKAFWKERKDSFMTEARRKFTYVIASPKYPAGAEKKPVVPVAAKPGDPVPEPSAADKEITINRNKADKETAGLIDDFIDELDQTNGGIFEQKSKQLNWIVKSSDLFSATTIPDSLLRLTPRRTDKTVEKFLFDFKTTNEPTSKFTGALPIAEADWLMARLDGEEAPRIKTFEEAKEEARRMLVEEKAREALGKVAEETHKKIKERLATGKSFTDITKELGLVVKSIGPLGNQEQPDGHPSASNIFASSQFTNLNSLTEIVRNVDSQEIVFVEKREVVKDPNEDQAIKTNADQMKNQVSMMTFKAWLDTQN
jgi:SurA N-terminal domain